MPMKLTDDLYAYVWEGNDNNCNTYIFTNVLTGNRHLIIDPGHIVTPYLKERAYDRLVKSIEADGLKILDIGLVVVSHAHPDHMEAVAKIREESHALVALGKEDEQAFKMFGGGKVDFDLEEGELKHDQLFQTKLEIIHTPGHSTGEVCIYWPDKKALAAGDVIFYHNTGRMDLPGGDGNLLKKSIERLSKLDVEYLLCGHPYEHPGVIQGREAVRENFEFVKRNIWF
jgi:glyoxylase-like metal-dependent hydrolase (beta-lactamase superfamily II)